MPFPRKFKQRLELEKTDVVLPDTAWITYAVCGCEPEACGWEGWILEAAFRKRHKGEKLLHVDTSQKCPVCRMVMFRTGASLKFTAAKDQSRAMIPGVDYTTTKMKYTAK